MERRPQFRVLLLRPLGGQEGTVPQMECRTPFRRTRLREFCPAIQFELAAISCQKLPECRFGAVLLVVFHFSLSVSLHPLRPTLRVTPCQLQTWCACEPANREPFQGNGTAAAAGPK